MAFRRINREFFELQSDPPSNYSVGLLEEGNLFNWGGTIQGPPNSCYQGGIFLLDIQLPRDYPFKPPDITFITKIYHPNVNYNGTICTDVLSDQWCPAYTIGKALLSIIELMMNPQENYNLMPEIACIYQHDRERFEATAREWVTRYASD